MNGSSSWANSSGFGQNQTSSGPGLFGNSSTGSALGPKSASMANLGALNTQTTQGGASSSLFKTTPTQNSGLSGGFTLGSSTTGGGLFGNSSTNNTNTNTLANTNTNASNVTNNGLFGNSSSATNQATSLFGNGSNNTGTASQSGGLFGNSTGSTTTQPGGLFGNSGNSTTAPSGGLFGNSATASNTNGGLFGKSTTPAIGTGSSQPLGGLFGSSTQQTNTNTTGGLFGAAAASNTNTNTGGLFGSANKPTTSGLFGTSNTPTGGNLFGNSLGNSSSGGLFSNPQPTVTNNSTINADPYKSNLVVPQVLNGNNQMPLSLTGTLFDTKPQSARRQSQIELHQKPKKSSLLGKLAQTFNIFRTSSAKSNIRADPYKGIFTLQNYITDTPRANTKEFSIGKKRPASPKFKIDNRNVGDIRKLVIKSKPSQFHLINADKVLSSKRRRVAQPLDSAKNVLTDDESSDEVQALKPLESQSAQPKNTTQLKANESPKPNLLEDPNGYFCLPTLSELSSLSQEQLGSVFNFIIGRVGYGQIAYNYPVDLLQLYEQFNGDFKAIQRELFGKIIKIDKTVVRAYDDPEVESPPMGCQLNVPATITLVAPPNANVSVDAHIKRLQNIIGMDFVTFDPVLNNWTFKVKHFSVWGLIDDGEDEDDEINENKRLREMKKKQDEQEDAANETYSRLYESSEFQNELKRQKVERQTSGLPGGWQFDTTVFAEGGASPLHAKQVLVLSEINQEVNRYKEGKSAFVRASNASDITADSEDESDTDDLDEIMNESVLPTEPRKYDYLRQIVTSMPSSGHFDDLIDEKAYEPDIEDEQAFDMMRPSASVPSSKDWILLLELANDIDSALSPAAVIKQGMPALEAVNEILFADLNHSPVDLGQASTPIKKLAAPAFSDSAASLQGLPDTKLNTAAMIQLVQNVLLNSRIGKRSNLYPLLSFSSGVSLETFAGIFPHDPDHAYLELASILFDEKDISTDPEFLNVDKNNFPLVNRLQNIRQRKSFANWLRAYYKRNTKNTSSNPMETIFYHVCCGNIKAAIEAAIASDNIHLSTLITLLDLNDAAVKKLAHAQLESWSNAGATSLVPTPILNIHKILAGQYDSLSMAPVPDIKLALQVFYGNNAEKLESVIHQLLGQLESREMRDLLMMYCHFKKEAHVEASDVLSQSNFSLKFKWILFQASGILSESGAECDPVFKSFANELEKAGLWKEAIAVVACCVDDACAQKSIRQIVLRNVNKMQASENSKDDERYLVSVLQVPREVIYEAISMEKRRQKDYWGCCEALVTAEMWEEAHEIICSELGPITVIESDSHLTSQLFSIIEKFPNRGAIIPSWNQGAELFVKYFETLEAYEERIDINSEDIDFLLDNTALSTVADNFTAQVAFKVLSRKVGDIAIENRGQITNLQEKINGLKLGENEKIYLTSRLVSA